MPLLRLQAQGRDRPRLEPSQADRLVGFLAIAVGAFLYPPQGFVDLADQLAFAIARAQFERAVRFEGSPVGDVGLGQALFLQVVQRLRGFLQQLGPPGQQLLTEILELKGVPAGAAPARPALGGKQRLHGCRCSDRSLERGGVYGNCSRPQVLHRPAIEAHVFEK